MARGAWATVIAVLLMGMLLPAVALAAPEPGDMFRYNFHRWVDNGGSWYEGYTDNTWSTGEYRVTGVNGSIATVRATYAWSHRSSEGLYLDGSEDRTVTFDTGTRRYTGAQTDLDDYDLWTATDLSVWFWVPPGLSPGEEVWILDDLFTVVSTDSTVWSGGLPRDAIELRAQGSGSRDDAYGQLSFTYTDTYFVDPATGYIIAERYREHDSGRLDGHYSTFDLSEDLDVKGTSYPVTLDLLALLAGVLGPAGVVALVALGAYAIRWRPIIVRRHAGVEKITIRRLWALDRFPRLPNAASDHFGDFLEDFANKALLAKDRVAVAVTDDKLVGLAIYTKEAKIGLVLCRDTELAEALRWFVGAKDFFSETRHPVSAPIRANAASWGVPLQSEHQYNVFETYHVMALGSIPAWAYDSRLVSRMSPADLPAMEEIAKAVYKAPARRWLAAQLASGDIGYVARVGGRIVGFAFATLAGTSGRLHTATVLPEFRNSGIGHELFRARLRALADLGAERALVEIAHGNLASLHIAGQHGFRQAGMLYVETTRTSRIERVIVRR